MIISNDKLLVSYSEEVNSGVKSEVNPSEFGVVSFLQSQKMK